MRAPPATHRQLGKAMRAVRKHLGVSQATLARRMGNTTSYVTRFETAHELPGDRDGGAWQRWQAAVQEIARSKPRTPAWHAHLHDQLTTTTALYTQTQTTYVEWRQQSAIATDAATAGQAGPRAAQHRPKPTPRQLGDTDWSPTLDERLNHTLQHPARADLVAVATLRQQVQDLDLRYEHEPSTALLADTGQNLSQVQFLQAHTAASRIQRELAAVEAESATLMGQLVWDASQRRDNATAHAYFDQAIEAARLVRNPAAEGLALLRKTFVALYGQRDPQAGLSLAEHTAHTTSTTSHVLTGLAVLHAAEAHAVLGRRQHCEQALSAAESQFAQVEPADMAIELFSPTQLGRLAGSCYLFLDDPKRAEPLLQQTAGAFERASKSQAIVLGNLALACLGQGKVDEAATRLHQAIDVVEQTWGGGGLNVVFGTGRKLRAWRQVPAVQEVSDRLLSLIAAA